jgi:hypothetical protein
MPQSTQPIPPGTTLGRQADVAFDAENHTSDAGTVLLRRIDELLRLVAALPDSEVDAVLADPALAGGQGFG